MQPDHYDADNWLNGCPNQCFTFEPPLSERIKTKAKKGASIAGLCVVGVIGLAVAIPVAIVALPFYGGYRLYKSKQRSRRRRRQQNLANENMSSSSNEEMGSIEDGEEDAEAVAHELPVVVDDEAI